MDVELKSFGLCNYFCFEMFCLACNVSMLRKVEETAG